MHKRARRRLILILTVSILVGCMSTTPVMADEPHYGLGLIPSDYDGPLYDVGSMGMLALPSSVDLSANLPPVRNQSPQNSCVGWAVAYYYKTYQESMERNWDVNSPEHQFSPSFVYNQRTTSDCGSDAGMTMANGLQIVHQKGAATLSSFPYTCPSGSSCDACTQPTQIQVANAYPYRSDSYAALFTNEGGADINALKTLLAAGKPFLIALPVYYSFCTVTYQNPVVPVPAPGEAFYGGHAMLVVGYDDTMGGFLTVNSWGSNWARQGYCYLSYDFVAQKAWEGWVMTDHIESQPTATPAPPTATPRPTSTPVTPTSTPVTPTDTPVTPTETSSATPTRSWATPTPQPTNEPNSPVDPTATPISPTPTTEPISPTATTEPPKPSIHLGQVLIEGYPAPKDTSVEVYMDGRVVTSAQTETERGTSRYTIEIGADDPGTQLVEGASEGDRYRYHIAGVEAKEDYVWHAGEQILRDFLLISTSSDVLELWINSYGPAAGGWSSFETFPRLLGDVNGDGAEDIVAFGNRATYVSLSTGRSFCQPEPWVYNYGPAAGGWVDYETFPRQLADVNGDGKADIVAFGNRATYVSLSTGSSFEAPTAWVLGYGVAAGGWVNFDTFPRQLADVNGDDMADIVAFGNRATYVSLSTGTSFDAPAAWVLGYGVAAGGWVNFDTFPRQLADVNGDGKADIVAFGNRATYVSLSTGASFGAPAAWVLAYGPAAGGWGTYDMYPRVLADMNGDGLDDIVAFGGRATYVSLSTGQRFATPKAWVGAYGTQAGGWSTYTVFPRDAADVSGDGRADLVGFSNAGVCVDVTTWDIEAVTVSVTVGEGNSGTVTEHDTLMFELMDAPVEREPALESLLANRDDSLPRRVAR